jgi:hypothetical protein
VSVVERFAFFSCESLESLIIQNPHCTIGDDTEPLNFILPYSYNGSISGYSDSTAYWYAMNHGISFISLGEAPVELEGDINNDGKFNIADVVLLQKWLLAVPDTRLANWKAADLYVDGKLNVFDLCMMKRALIQQQN